MLQRLFDVADNRTLGALMLAGMAIVISFLLLRTTRLLARRRDSTAPGRPRFDQRRESTSAPPEAVEWDVKMHETARELFGQLDSKMSALMALTAEADRAAARLETATRAAADSRRTNHQADALRAEAKPAAEPPSLADSRDEAYDSLANRGPAPGDRRKDEIYTLADYGHDASEIAQRTRIPVGEVELILSLRSR